MTRAVAGLAVLLLAGCAAADMHAARDPWGRVIGMSAIDFEECAGAPNRTQQLAPTVAILEWDNTPTSNRPLFSMTLPFGFQVQAGQQSTCHMTATVTDTGTVARLEFSGLGVTSDGEACSQMIRACVQRAENTSTISVDSFKYLLLPIQNSPVKK
jgi:hypothetical protein